MNFEPQKFFVGLIDFFAVWLPGALLIYLFMNGTGPSLFEGARFEKASGSEAVVVFLFASYLVGHFIFLIGSWVLDDYVYDPIRTATEKEQIIRLANGGRRSWKLSRLLAALLIRRDADTAVARAVEIQHHYLDPLRASSAINAFQWSKARLMLEKPQALEAVQRFEADSKFFRSLLIVLCVVLVWATIQSRLLIAPLGLLLILAFWRYVEQRLKATSQAYRHVITLESQLQGGYRAPSTVAGNGPSHGGGVVYRRRAGQIEFLLVQATNSKDDWVLPKGHVEPDERMRETAVREVREETGVWARVEAKLERIPLEVNGNVISVQFYLMEALAQGKPGEGRDSVWLSLANAHDRATHRETKDLLMAAEQKRKQFDTKEKVC